MRHWRRRCAVHFPWWQRTHRAQLPKDKAVPSAWGPRYASLTGTHSHASLTVSTCRAPRCAAGACLPLKTAQSPLKAHRPPADMANDCAMLPNETQEAGQGTEHSNTQSLKSALGHIWGCQVSHVMHCYM